MNELWGALRKATASATWSGVPQRPPGIIAVIRSTASGVLHSCCAAPGEASMGPGAPAWTRMRRDAIGRPYASTRLNAGKGALCIATSGYWLDGRSMIGLSAWLTCWCRPGLGPDLHQTNFSDTGRLTRALHFLPRCMRRNRSVCPWLGAASCVARVSVGRCGSRSRTERVCDR